MFGGLAKDIYVSCSPGLSGMNAVDLETIATSLRMTLWSHLRYLSNLIGLGFGAGHGSDENNCAEFCVTQHVFTINGWPVEISFDDAGTLWNCTTHVRHPRAPSFGELFTRSMLLGTHRVLCTRIPALIGPCIVSMARICHLGSASIHSKCHLSSPLETSNDTSPSSWLVSHLEP